MGNNYFWLVEWTNCDSQDEAMTFGEDEQAARQFAQELEILNNSNITVVRVEE